ncbi:RILP-like protein 1 isoform X2 [Corythoichthys intestinalis]|uniref:RILP-like protein 1 isoform X2 n=1 Tax=Corythoichthys intestinalis TaxID=161448 RepID=UPI0025A5EA28|nr:RILP-like protein 1 isoform X2 [Corythoichthys intestinalis]
MELPASHTDAILGCFDKNCSSLTVDDVYDIAKVIGTELERLIDGYGKESVLGLVPRVVKVLELLESFTARNQVHKYREEELLRTFESLQLQQKKKTSKDSDELNENHETREQQQQKESQQWKSKCEDLQVQIQQLQGDNELLQSRLKGSYAHDDRVQRQEREVMLKLKQVVDKQRDELRAKVQEITGISREVEALQEQLERFMKMNAELRHKQNVLQAQLKSTVERKADMEADLKEKVKVIEKLQEQMDRTNSNNHSSPSQINSTTEPSAVHSDPDQPCFTKKEVRDIIFERNELKTNLFLVQEELNYYQREILNEERCPGFLLEAVRSAITKRRKVIKAKMLGIPPPENSSDEEDKCPVTEVDGTEKPAESRIRNLLNPRPNELTSTLSVSAWCSFGFLTWSGSGRSPSHMSNATSSWEIIADSEASGESPQ